MAGKARVNSCSCAFSRPSSASATSTRINSATTGSARRMPTEKRIEPNRIIDSAELGVNTNVPGGMRPRLSAKRRNTSRSRPMVKKSIPEISCAKTMSSPESACVVGSMVEA